METTVNWVRHGLKELEPQQGSKTVRMKKRAKWESERDGQRRLPPLPARSGRGEELSTTLATSGGRRSGAGARACHGKGLHVP